MKDLSVGMYIRTTDGLLALLTELYNENSVIVKWQYDEKRRRESFSQSISKDYIKKATHNIIDLIEVGDYVNGYKVSLKGYDYAHFVQCDYPVENGTTNHYKFYKQAIKSVVTKEQYESMKYVVE